MEQWNKVEDKLPEIGKVVKVKVKPFPDAPPSGAVLVNTDWGTTEWVYCGMINMDIDMVTEWAEV